MFIIITSRRSILIAERVALNFLQRMSGVATLTRRMVDAVQVNLFVAHLYISAGLTP